MYSEQKVKICFDEKLIRKVILTLLIVLFLTTEKISCRNVHPSFGQQYIHFSTSTNNSLAQEHFILGLAYLHSFSYSLALEQFIQAYNLDSQFAMAYVFSSLTYSEPVWLIENPEKSWQQVKLMNLKIHFDKLTQREQLYVTAVRKFFDQGIAHYDDYINELKKLHHLFPHDHEAALFLVGILFSKTQLGIRGYLKRNTEDRHLQMIILDKILKENPNHPGALHYFIHFYDEPKTASLALSNAIKYSRVASSSPHAQHMPTHIYLRLGLFKQVAIGNLQSDEAGLNIEINHEREYHSIEYMHYAYLNIGRRSIARDILETIRKLVHDDIYLRLRYGIMSNRYIVETQDYNFIFDYPLDLIKCLVCTSLGDIYWMEQINAGLLLVKGFSTIKNNKKYNPIIVKEYIEQLKNMSIKHNKTQPTFSISLQAMILQLKAFHQYFRLSKTKEEKNIALNYAKTASKIELSINPPSYGPPIDPVKPSQELYGELLLENREYEKAIDEFLNVMTYFPNRTLTVLGLARAYASLNKTNSACFYYSRLINDIFYNPDIGLVWYDEALNYLAEHRTSNGIWYRRWTFVGIIMTIAVIGIILVLIFVLLLFRNASHRNYKYQPLNKS